jgi:integrase
MAKLLERFGSRPGDEHVSTTNLNSYVVRLKTLFGWAIKRGRLPEGASNPFAEQHRKVGKKAAGATGWLPFTIDELNTLFAAPIFLDTTSAMRWLPLVSLFTGMRVGEIAQLQTTDLRSEGDT